jgi:NAD(P)H-hydrate epimerase
MLKAGQRVALEARQMTPKGGLVYIFCGPGNNGGDGFVAASELLSQGYKVIVFLLVEPNKLKGAAKEVFTKLKSEYPEVIKEFSLTQLQQMPKPHLVVDAIFGFGFKKELSGVFKEAIKAVNSLKVPVLAVDVPSGLIADTGQVGGLAVKASKTVTFTTAKVGLKMLPGAMYAGEVVTAAIGINSSLVAEFCSVYTPEPQDILQLLPKRAPDAHKGSCGRVLVIAGAQGFSGAAAMTAQAVLKLGAGLVVLGLPQSLNGLMETKLTEVITWPLPETKEKTLAQAAAAAVIKRLPEFNCLVIGPGLTTNRETVFFVKEVLAANENTPQLLDADALNCLAETPEVLAQLKAPTLITPHPGELSRLLKVSVSQIQANRLYWAQEAFKRLQVVVLLKGAGTIVQTESYSYINPTGNAGLATAGTGDILAGMIGALMAQGLTVSEAALAGSYLHGLAADIAVKDLTEFCLIATDLLVYLPKAIKSLRGEDAKS